MVSTFSTSDLLELIRSSADVVKIDKFISDGSIDVNQTCDVSKSNPLHEASEIGDLDVIKLLLSHGADINAQTESGVTALHIAIFFGHKDCAEYLIEKGASINILDGFYNSPLFYSKNDFEREYYTKLYSRVNSTPSY